MPLAHYPLGEVYKKYNFVRPTSLPRSTSLTRFHCSLGYRTPAEVAYSNIVKNSKVVL
jgi:hypothetical protein